MTSGTQGPSAGPQTFSAAAEAENSGLTRLEDELRAVQARIDGVRGRMRAATDVFGLLGFALAFAGLVVVAGLAAVSFASGETGVGMLFSALTLVALPMVGVAAWHAFGRMWTLRRELSLLRRKEAEIFDELATAYEPAGAVPTAASAGSSGLFGFFGGRKRDPMSGLLPPGHTPTGFREPRGSGGARTAGANRGPGRGAALWLLVGVGLILLLFVVGVAMGNATR